MAHGQGMVSHPLHTDRPGVGDGRSFARSLALNARSFGCAGYWASILFGDGVHVLGVRWQLKLRTVAAAEKHGCH